MKERMSAKRKLKDIEQKDKSRIKAKENENYLKRKYSLEEEENMSLNEEAGSEVSASESEWEDQEETEKVPEYNNMKLPNFSRECDRYKISNRAAAKLGNGLLKDLKLVTKQNTRLLIGPCKVRRERLRWGGVLEKSHQAEPMPGGLYCDGKKCPTLTRISTSVPVQVRGAKGRGSRRIVETTSVQKVQTEHFSCVSQPGGKYLTHVTPDSGTGNSIAKEVVAVVRERDISLEVLGMDGTAVNTGVHNGVIRLVEQELGLTVQIIICLLHLNELPLRHLFCILDGVTSGPNSFKGKIGTDVSGEVWKEAIVAFPLVKGKLPILTQEEQKELSRDQRLLYQLGRALETGVVPDTLAAAVIGPLLHARWLTFACRILRKALSTRRPSKTLSKILHFLMNVYIPAWFQIKFSPHCQNGAKHFYFMLELTKELEPHSQGIVQKVLQNNSYFAHPENIIISCLADQREDVRQHAVLYILEARKNFDLQQHPRQFLPPKIKLEAESYTDMIDWSVEQKTEPPLTKKMTKEEILGAVEKPITLPSYPCHTQDVERVVPVVTESCLQKVGYTARHRWIISTMESRRLVPKFDTKKDDA